MKTPARSVGPSPSRLLLACALASLALGGGAARGDVEPRAPYTTAAEAIERFLAREVADKGLPALSIALVDDRAIVWARGFGLADPEARRPATAETVYRVGSISKLFTDIAVMQLVERGEIDLDAPVGRHLPEFRPRDPFGKPITLRQMMAHRSGLVRESLVGNYFDPTRPSLEATVRSLNDTALVYEPGTRTKYSNAALAVVGYVVERVRGEPFAASLERTVLRPLALERTGFEPRPGLTDHLARGLMWTYDGRTFDAPGFPLGTGPAGNLYSTAVDLGRFLSALFADGGGPGGPILEPETLKRMQEPQFAGPGERAAFGLGFALGELDGHRKIGHGGAIYGHSTELAALPDEKLGVVVCASKDGANGVTRRAAEIALRAMLAARRGEPMPEIEAPGPVPPGLGRELEGRYGDADKGLDLVERPGKLFMVPRKGGFRVELRRLGDALVVDDCLAYGTRLIPDADRIRRGADSLDRLADEEPPPMPERWAGLIGEYGRDENILFILEKDGKLHALIEWFFLYPLEEEAPDVFRFPDHGLYEGEKVVFAREPDGRASRIEAASVSFARRRIDGEDGTTFRIKPLRPVDELRPEALAARPPRESGDFRTPELVDLTTLDPTIRLDIRYATADNFLGTPLYSSVRAFLQRPAAEALLRAHRSLKSRGFGLLIHDAYRPWHVTRMFWDATPGPSRMFVADPSKGSRHNRGAAVDLTLYDLETGRPVAMVGGYDEFSRRSYPDYPGGTSLQRRRRDLLRRAMEDQGFTVNEVEWWHFDYKDWPSYPILNATFEQLDAPARP